MDPLAAVAAVTVMLTVVAVAYAFYGSALPAHAVRGRLEGLMSGTSVVDISPIPGALRQTRTGGGFLASLFSGRTTEDLRLQLERADLTIQPGEYIGMRLILAIGGGFLPWAALTSFTFRADPIALLAAAAGLVVGYNAPRFWLKRRRKARIERLNAQLPEALTIISNALKAGFGLLQALDNAADNLSHPISTELKRTIHEMNVGSSAEEALVALSERSGSYDLDIVVTAILVQRTVGGNLGEILDTVAGTMRERIRIKGEIQTLTAQQKLTGIVIGLLPIAVGGIFMVTSPGYIDPLFTTLLGKLLVGFAVVLETVGVMIIQRILDIEV
jgi:tight adherence protein B